MSAIAASGATLGGLTIANGIDTESTGNTIPRAEDQTAFQCNLMPNSGFDAPVTDNFYRDSNNPEVVRIVERIELGGNALQVGDTRAYGLYGQIVPISTDIEYQFSLAFHSEGPIEIAELTVSWLDAQWQPMVKTESDELIETSLSIEAKSGTVSPVGIHPPC